MLFPTLVMTHGILEGAGPDRPRRERELDSPKDLEVGEMDQDTMAHDG